MMTEAQEELEEKESNNIIPISSIQKEAKICSSGLSKIVAYAASISILIIAIGFGYISNNYSNAASRLFTR